MLVFSTRLPLKAHITSENCLELFKTWVEQSPHYPIEQIDWDVSSGCDLDWSKDSISISVRHYREGQTELTACRLTDRKRHISWLNDCVFWDRGGEKSILIQQRRNCAVPSDNPYRVRKPHIVRMLVERGFCRDDGGLPITDTVLDARTQYRDACAQIIRGKHPGGMPSVFVGCDGKGEPVVNAQYVAAQLGGLAHTFVQKEGAPATEPEAQGHRAGYVSVYYPGEKLYHKYALPFCRDDREMSWLIINDIRTALTHKPDAFAWGWDQVQARLIWQQLPQDMRAEGSQLSAYLGAFDRMQQELLEQIQALNAQANFLRAQADTYRGILAEDQPSCMPK